MGAGSDGVRQADSGHFAVLDGLRGVAALAVVVMHIGEILLLPNCFPQAYLAVPFFFILSGFVVAYAYEDGLMRRTTAVGFMFVRVERLYPMLVVGLAISIAVGVFRTLSKGNTLSVANLSVSVLAAIAMFPRPGPSAFALLPPQWSLAIELWGNLMHYLLRKVLTTRALILALPLTLVAMIWGAFYYGGLGTGWALENLLGGVATFAFSYGLGILLFRFWQQDRLPRIPMPLWAIVIVLALTLIVPQPLRTSANATRDLICAVILYPLILTAALTTKMNARSLGIASLLGRLSYPVYIIHYPIVTFCCFALLRLHLPLWAKYAAVPIIVFVTTAVSLILLKLLDEPFRRWAKDIRIVRARVEPAAIASTTAAS